MSGYRTALLDWLACAYGGCSQRAARAAIVLAAELDLSVGDALDAYAAGFEAMGALSRSHDLYAGGWHPTAVCGAVGAAHTAARLLGLDEDRAALITPCGPAWRSPRRSSAGRGRTR